jgi:hypothetical protein
MRRHAVWLPLSALAAGLLLNAGCLDKPTLAKPGASGHIVFHLWGKPDEPPTIFRTDELTQEGNRFDHLVMKPVEVRRPFEDGVIFIQSPKGEYFSPKSAGAVSENTIVMDGPVRLSGMLRGEPVVGLGQSAVMRRSDLRAERKLVMTDVVLVTRGSLATARELTTDEQGRISVVDYRQEPKQSPAVANALAALPRPLVFPEFRESDRQRAGVEEK